MLPVIALLGSPNVGKSTLFNVLTRSRDALVADFPGLTRDRQYGVGKLGPRAFLVVDTGGFTGERDGLLKLMADQALLAAQEADLVLFLVDARAGLSAADQEIVRRLRRLDRPVVVVANKAEGMTPASAGADFTSLGLGEPAAISAAHGHGVGYLMDRVFAALPGGLDSTEERRELELEEERPEPFIAVFGRPNVGKSTLVNRLVGEERVLAADLPGTTRDSVFVPFQRGERRYTLIDTAGVRRRTKVTEPIEKFSVIKALQAIEAAQVVVLVLDARQGVSDQDARLVGYTLEAGRGLVLAVNKWDGLPSEERERVKAQVERHLPFVDFAPLHYISALEGTGLGGLMASVDRVYASATRQIPTPLATRILGDAVTAYPPPLVNGRRIKLRYAHQGGRIPPRIIIHGNQTEAVSDAYRRYLVNAFRKALELVGTPLLIEFKGSDNPYQGRANVLTHRQVEKRRRLMKHVKKR